MTSRHRSWKAPLLCAKSGYWGLCLDLVLFHWPKCLFLCQYQANGVIQVNLVEARRLLYSDTCCEVLMHSFQVKAFQEEQVENAVVVSSEYQGKHSSWSPVAVVCFPFPQSWSGRSRHLNLFGCSSWHQLLNVLFWEPWKAADFWIWIFYPDTLCHFYIVFINFSLYSLGILR